MNRKVLVAKMPDGQLLTCSLEGDDAPLLLPSTVGEEGAAAICRLTLDVQELRREKGRLDLDETFSPVGIREEEILARLPNGRWVAYREEFTKPFLALPAGMDQSAVLQTARGAVAAPAYLLVEVLSQDNFDEPAVAAVPWAALGRALRWTARMLEVKERLDCFSITWLDYDVVWLSRTPEMDPEDEDTFGLEGWIVLRGNDLPWEARCDVKTPEFVTTGDLIGWQCVWGGYFYSTRAPWFSVSML